MKRLSFYNTQNLNTDDEVFNYFINTLTPVIHKLNFYVNWDKVFLGVEKYKIELGILNTLCGSLQIENDFRTILHKYPEVIQVFSLLIGVRGEKIQVLKDINEDKFSFLHYEFKKKNLLNEDEIENYVLFFKESGLLISLIIGESNLLEIILLVLR